MNAKTILSLIAVVLIGIVAVAWMNDLRPGNQTEDFLPDHITVIEGTTLPRAIQEARQRGKTSVTITDAASNTIRADLSSPTHTVITLTGAGATDALTILEDAGIDTSAVFATEEGEGDTYTFTVSEVQHAELAGFLYEISLRVFNISSTTEWTIDIE